MGACKDLYEEFKSEPGFDVSGSQKAIQNLLNRDVVSFLGTGIFILYVSNIPADWRYIFITFEDTILPFVKYNINNARCILTLFRDIQRCLYLSREKYEKDKKRYITRLFVNSFLFGYAILNRWGRSAYTLYTHDIWCHTAYQFAERSLLEISTERGERTFSKDKHIFKYLTNRRLEEGLLI